MKYLLDTHTLIWFSEDDPKLPEKVKFLIEKFEDDFFVSIATLWEMSIKISKGTLFVTKSLEETIQQIFANGFRLHPISHLHTIRLQSLPVIHKDPFDRMLITQSLLDGMILISKEELFDSYFINRFW